MNGGWKRKVQGSACAVIATACLVAMTGMAPGPVAALWTGGHGSSGSSTVVFVERGSGSTAGGHSLHLGRVGHGGAGHRSPAGQQQTKGVSG